jgi:hypothetical protein
MVFASPLFVSDVTGLHPCGIRDIERISKGSPRELKVLRSDELTGALLVNYLYHVITKRKML